MSSFDSWLTTDPREKSGAEEDAYVRYCEANELDPEGDHWEAFEDEMNDRAEDAMIDAYERSREEY